MRGLTAATGTYVLSPLRYHEAESPHVMREVAAEVERYREESYRHLVKKANVPGFRKGKAPRSIFEQFVGRESLLEDALKSLVPKAYEGALREKTRAMNVEPFVVFAGYRKDVERLYGIMDISVLPSLSEGLSLTVLESMAHGLPVVATRVGGNPEIITDGQNGYLVPPGDACSLADRIVRLLLDADLRRRMGSEGRERIGSRFRLRDVADRYLDVYRGVISR